MKIENTTQLAALINKRLQLVRDGLWEDMGSRVDVGIDLDFCGSDIYITLTSEGSKKEEQDLSLNLSADIQRKELVTGESIVEFKNIDILSIESDSYAWGTEEIKLDEDDSLKEAVTRLILDANFYHLVDSKTYTTDDLDMICSEMSENFEKYGY